MTSRFEDTVIKDTDVILSTKSHKEQVRCLLNQLVESTNFTSAQFEMGNSTYFNKHYDGKNTTIRNEDSQVTNMIRLAESQSSNGTESYMYRVESGDVSDINSMAHRSGLTSLGGDRRLTDMRRQTLISNQVPIREESGEHHETCGNAKEGEEGNSDDDQELKEEDVDV